MFEIPIDQCRIERQKISRSFIQSPVLQIMQQAVDTLCKSVCTFPFKDFVQHVNMQTWITVSKHLTNFRTIEIVKKSSPPSHERMQSCVIVASSCPTRFQLTACVNWLFINDSCRSLDNAQRQICRLLQLRQRWQWMNVTVTTNETKDALLPCL